MASAIKTYERLFDAGQQDAAEAAKTRAEMWKEYAKQSEEWLSAYYNYLQEETKGIHYVENAVKGSIDAQWNDILNWKDKIGESLMSSYVLRHQHMDCFLLRLVKMSNGSSIQTTRSPVISRMGLL